MNKDVKTVAEYVRDLGVAPPFRVQDAAKRLLGGKRAKAARSRVLPGHPAAERANGQKKQAETEKNEETARLRREALERAAGRCELCHGVLGAAEGIHCWRPEMAHLDGGSGKRREEQWIGNVLIAHHYCHQSSHGIDKRPLLWLAEVKAWASFHGYPVPKRFVKLEALHPEVKP